MLKHIALTTVIAGALAAVLSVSVTATASAMTTNPLSEWSSFGKETMTPIAAYDESIDWANLYQANSPTQLIEWSGFGKETKTPMVAYNKNIDWANLYN